MGTLKIEIDLPEFKNEINLNITIKRDGEIVYSSSSPEVNSGTITNVDKSMSNKLTGEDVKFGDEIDNKPKEKSPTKSKPKSSIFGGGNLMAHEF